MCWLCLRNGVIPWHGGSGACTACTAASQQEGHGFDSRMGRCWLCGAGPPQTFSAQVGYLPGLSVCSLHVHKGFPPLRTPTEKHARRTEHMSIPDQRCTVHFTWAPGASSCPLLLGGPGGGMFQDGKRQRINSPRPQACVCVSVYVCPVAPPYMHVCVPVCRVCH